MIPCPTDTARALLIEWLGPEPLAASVRDRLVRGLATTLAEHQAENDRNARELQKAWATALKTAALLDAFPGFLSSRAA